MYPSQSPQISALITKKTFTKLLAEYLDFTDIFSPDLAAELFEYVGINNYAIKLVDGQQPPYGPIYSLELVEMETLKVYIETNLAHGFIKPSKSLADTSILFNQKSDGSLRLYVNYRGLNNLSIKNRYPLPLIGELLDKLGKARQFTQLDLTSAYHQTKIHKGDKWKTAFRI